MKQFAILDLQFAIYNLAMGTFKIKCKVENIINRKKAAVIPKMLVDMGSEYT